MLTRKLIGSCYRHEERIHAEKGKGVSIVKGGKRRGV